METTKYKHIEHYKLAVDLMETMGPIKFRKFLQIRISCPSLMPSKAFKLAMEFTESEHGDN